MKMNTSINKTPKGVTLIELSVVIAVILVLISVLFIGASYYRDSANAAACTVNQSSIEKGVESFNNIEQAELSYADLSTSGPFVGNVPTCPSPTAAGAYTITWANDSATVDCVDNASHN